MIHVRVCYSEWHQREGGAGNAGRKIAYMEEGVHCLSGRALDVNDIRDDDVAVSLQRTRRGNALFLEFSLCLSRACLGTIIVFIYKWLKKTVFHLEPGDLLLYHRVLHAPSH